MKRLNIALCGLLGLLLTGCGQTVVETLQVPTASGPNAVGKGKTVVILPFADYSFADSLASAHRRDMAVAESLTDRFVANGFKLPIQEDVFAFMVDESFISVVNYEQKNTISLNYELTNDWSDVMKDQISAYISQQHAQHDNEIVASPGTHGLNEQSISKIGRKFHADYIVRGRILEYRTRQEHSWAPWKRGILPFISGTSSQFMFGFADTNQYDNLNNKIVGGTWGAIIGSRVNGPWDPNEGGSSILGVSGGADANTVFWGAVGSLLGGQAHNSGKVDQAVVQMRIWIQEAATGHVIWTNRIDVKVSPETVLADKQYDALFNQAIEKGVTTLVDNFITSSFNASPVDSYPQPIITSPPPVQFQTYVQ